MTVDVKHKRRPAIEFLLLTGRERDDIVLPLQNAYGRDADCQTSGFRWVNEIRRGNKEFRNEGRPRRSYRYETDAAPCSILETIRMLHCEPSRARCQSPRRRLALICRGLAIP
jgi:hypothetical protein